LQPGGSLRSAGGTEVAQVALWIRAVLAPRFGHICCIEGISHHRRDKTAKGKNERKKEIKEDRKNQTTTDI
jgi:hypothetical protein